MRGNPDKIKGQGFHTNPERINKSGRPKKLPEIDDLLAEVLGQGDKARLILEALTKRALAKGGDRAAEILLDRGWGKPKQTITNDGEITVTVTHES